MACKSGSWVRHRLVGSAATLFVAFAGIAASAAEDTIPVPAEPAAKAAFDVWSAIAPAAINRDASSSGTSRRAASAIF